MDYSAKNADFQEKKLPPFFRQTSELNCCPNYEYYQNTVFLCLFCFLGNIFFYQNHKNPFEKY